MQHSTLDFEFNSLIAHGWDTFPTAESLKNQIATVALAQSELKEWQLGFFSPPDKIVEVHLTSAARDQIICMWHGHRKLDKQSPPSIPLRLFVFGFGTDSGGSWANLEVLPGLDTWEAE